MKYFVYAKKGVDYSKYGFVPQYNYEKTAIKGLVLEKRYPRIFINIENYRISFNIPTNEMLKIFADMVKDDVVEFREEKKRKPRNHTIALDDDEFELIKKLRIEKEKENNDYERNY